MKRQNTSSGSNRQPLSRYSLASHNGPTGCVSGTDVLTAKDRARS